MKSLVREHFSHHQVPFHNHCALTFFSEASSFSKHQILSHYVRFRDRNVSQTWSVLHDSLPLLILFLSGSRGDSTQVVGWGFVGLV